MNAIHYLAMLLLSYFALFAAHRCGASQLKYNKYKQENGVNASYTTRTNYWSKTVIWLGLCLFSLAMVFKVAP
jgi:hypothetical protein